MHIRVDRKRLKDGTDRGYVSLAHNVWVEGPMGKKWAKPVIFARLGVEEDLDVEMLRSARGAFDRYLQKRLAREGGTEDTVTEVVAETRKQAPTLKVLASREYGLWVLVEAAWRSLDLHQSLKRIARKHDIAFDFERVVFGMVRNRLVDPQSKRAQRLAPGLRLVPRSRGAGGPPLLPRPRPARGARGGAARRASDGGERATVCR
ncbi:MAG: hypothetical protein EA397_04820 [Deltaproteobacteria bacterium]|nr:MAG: hypothetical protein EA397_04820 [Deltaproteobacteria bacterium]